MDDFDKLLLKVSVTIGSLEIVALLTMATIGLCNAYL